MQTCWVYMTTRNKQEAEKIGSALIEDNLAACVNIIEGMQSMFWWKGEVQSDEETILIAKTKEEIMDKLEDKVKALHSDDCPCIVGLPIQCGNNEFISWIHEETK